MSPYVTSPIRLINDVVVYAYMAINEVMDVVMKDTFYYYDTYL
jgi:hypothetical protein